jgi:hypothetical protein
MVQKGKTGNSFCSFYKKMYLIKTGMSTLYTEMTTCQAKWAKERKKILVFLMDEDLYFWYKLCKIEGRHRRKILSAGKKPRKWQK